MAKTTDTNVLYKYRINQIQLIRGREVITLEWTNVQSIVIYKGYDDYVRPQYVLNLQLDNKTILWINKYQNDFQVYLDIYKVLTSDDGIQIGPTSQFIRGNFIAVNPTASGLSTARIEKIDPTAMDDTSTNNLGEMSPYPISIGLLQREMYNYSCAPCNTVIEKDNLQNIVASMLTRAGFKRVLMSPFQNSVMYEDLLIPPLPLYRGIQYIDFKYGFYKAGSIIFYDYDTVYIIDSSMRSITKERNSDPYITLDIYDATESTLNGHVYGVKQCELFVSNSTTSIISSDNATDMSGSSTTNINIDTGEKSVITNDSQNEYSFSSTALVYGNNNEAFTRQRQIENKMRITFSGYHYDISKFNPNSIVSIYHSNPSLQKKLKGKYRITSVTAELNNSGDNFVANTSVSLAFIGD